MSDFLDEFARAYAARELGEPVAERSANAAVDAAADAPSPQIEADELVAPRVASGTGPIDTPDTVAQLLRALEIANDRTYWLALSLTKLVAYLEKHGGYMSASNQRALRSAKALLREQEGDAKAGVTEERASR